MEIGDKLELVLVAKKEECSCKGCIFANNPNCPDDLCSNGVFEISTPKQNHITFKNVSSNILHDSQGNQKLLDLVLPITPENLEAVHQAYRKTGKLTVEIYLDKGEIK